MGSFIDGINSIISLPFNRTDVVIVERDEVFEFKFVYPNM
jgi:hypothetical protein